ncbi:MAG: hypothetical protein JXA44_00100 [Methanospirillaceae archaeon]|nr:hypothetical protein [Methanospirillaceae archaeon]
MEKETDKSITELEILHGVMNNPNMEDHAFFYFRNKAYLESEAFKATVHEAERAGFSDTDEDRKRPYNLSDGSPVLERSICTGKRIN